MGLNSTDVRFILMEVTVSIERRTAGGGDGGGGVLGGHGRRDIYLCGNKPDLTTLVFSTRKGRILHMHNGNGTDARAVGGSTTFLPAKHIDLQ